MVLKCIVRDCRSEWYPACDVIFHKFPSDTTERNKWLSIVPLRRPFFENARICSNHFKDTDYDTTGKRLLFGVTPFYEKCNMDLISDEEQTVTKTIQPTSINYKMEMRNMPSTSHHEPMPLRDTTNEIENICPSKKPRLLEILDTPQQDENKSKQEQTVTKIIQPTSINYKMEMRNMPSTSHHEPMPLRDTTNEIENICPSKKPRLLEILDTPQQDENKSKQVNNQSTSPIQFGMDKSIQAKIKTPREEGLEKRNKFWAEKVRRLNKSVKTLKSLMNIVKAYASNSEIDNIIQGNFANICKEFKKPPKRSPHGVRYSDEVKSFALTLHFHSAKAYDFLRKYVALPHVETLRRSLSTFNCNVGFLTEVLEYLKVQLETQEKPFLKNVALIFDGMALRQDLAYDQKLDKVFGYVDLGEISVTNPEELATEALVFQIVSYTTYFKCPIAYFLIKNSLSGDLLAELLKTAVIMLDNIGITVRSMTCDGAPSNVKAYESLGCSLDQNNFKPHFPHPNGQDNIYCFLDAAHMLKLARNVFAEFNIQSATGTTSFQYLRELHVVQKEEGLKFGNKLSTTHVDYKNKKMNVKLAAQVLSSSVADAIDFLRQSGNLFFLGSEPTVEFIKMIDRLFDLMNSKSPFGRGFKSPLSEKNKAFWEPIFKESKNYLLSLTIDGKNILSHGRKTFALGFLMGIENFPLLLNALIKDPINPIKYLLTFKCSQDNLEIFFSCIRARGRTHDNPSPLEFRYRMRKLLFKNSIQPSINANSVDHTFEASHVFDYGQKNVSLIDSTADDDSDDYTEEMENQIYALELEFTTTVTEYQKNILYYITGYIVKQIIKKQNCDDCKNMLIAPEHSQSDHFYNLNVNRYQSFTLFVNRGKLCFPSAEAFSIVVYADKVFKNMLNMDKLTSFNIKNKMINLVNQHFTSKLRQMFCHPTDDSVNCTDLHESKIVKLISNSFLSIRLRSYLKNVMDQKLSAIRSKRQKLHKTIIFNHV